MATPTKTVPYTIYIPENIESETSGIVIPNKQEIEIAGLVFTGKNSIDYGQYRNQNFLNLLANFASEEDVGNPGNPPSGIISNPIIGQTWYDKTEQVVKVWNGSTWDTAGSTDATDITINPGATGLSPDVESAILEINQKAENNSAAISSNDTDISNLQAAVSGNDTDISNLQAAVSGNDTDITNLQNEISNIDATGITAGTGIITSGNIGSNNLAVSVDGTVARTNNKNHVPQIIYNANLSHNVNGSKTYRWRIESDSSELTSPDQITVGMLIGNNYLSTLDGDNQSIVTITAKEIIADLDDFDVFFRLTVNAEGFSGTTAARPDLIRFILYFFGPQNNDANATFVGNF